MKTILTIVRALHPGAGLIAAVIGGWRDGAIHR